MTEPMRIGAHYTHPAADAFPLMDDEALKGLAEDIKANGLRCPIVLIGDTDNELILDGRNRYLACLLAKVEPLFTYYEGAPDEVLRFVISYNLARREMEFVQRALSSRRLLKTARVRKEREKLQPLLPHVPEAADHAIDEVMSGGCDELRDAMERGEIDLSIASQVAKLEPEQQRNVLRKMAEPEPVKSKPVSDYRSKSIELNAADMAAFKALIHAGEASIHGVVRAGAALAKRMVEE